MTNRNITAAALAAVAWALLVSASPRWFFAAAAPFCVVWIALSARAAPHGLRERLRVRAADLLAGVAAAAVLHGLTRAFLAVSCGAASARCAPVAAMFARFDTRTPWAVLVLGLLVAPAEELFWRGAVQERLARRVGRTRAIGFTTLGAAALALATGEPILALATVPTHAAWGALSAWRRSLVPALVSHALWTALVASVPLPLS